MDIFVQTYTAIRINSCHILTHIRNFFDCCFCLFFFCLFLFLQVVNHLIWYSSSYSTRISLSFVRMNSMWSMCVCVNVFYTCTIVFSVYIRFNAVKLQDKHITFYISNNSHNHFHHTVSELKKTETHAHTNARRESENEGRHYGRDGNEFVICTCRFMDFTLFLGAVMVVHVILSFCQLPSSLCNFGWPNGRWIDIRRFIHVSEFFLSFALCVILD